LVSLRVFSSKFHFDGEKITDGFLSFITEISDRAPKLEYASVYDFDILYYGKRVSGEWVDIDESEFSETWPNIFYP
jgi:hypothetical protein